MSVSRLRVQVAPLEALPLRVRARRLAAGALGGGHRAERKGSGVEFAGHRPYTPGDDLRHLDRHALLRHGRYMIREFIAEAQRPRLCLLDATASMAYRSDFGRARGATTDHPSKLDLALVLGLALLLAAHKRGDPVGLAVVGRTGRTYYPARRGTEHLERLTSELERIESEGADGVQTEANFAEVLAESAARTPRSAEVIVISDFLDMDDDLRPGLLRLCTQRREVIALGLLDPAELEFPFSGQLVLRDPESGVEIETDAERTQADYLAKLAAHQANLTAALGARGATYVVRSTASPAADVLRELFGRA
jgi:uncharacterized protein (DUF58 family)